MKSLIERKIEKIVEVLDKLQVAFDSPCGEGLNEECKGCSELKRCKEFIEIGQLVKELKNMKPDVTFKSDVKETELENKKVIEELIGENKNKAERVLLNKDMEQDKDKKAKLMVEYWDLCSQLEHMATVI